MLKNLVLCSLIRIFVHEITTNVDMTRTGTIYNALNMRGLQEIPPPVSRNHIKIRYTLRGALCALSMTRDWYLSYLAIKRGGPHRFFVSINK